MMDILVPAPRIDTETEIARLARRHDAAGGIGISLLNIIGAQMDGVMSNLPKDVQAQLGRATEAALYQALTVASRTRAWVPDQPRWMNRAVGSAMGAAGGFGGLPTALAELPLTTTMLLRVIEGVAEDHGFDPRAPSVRFDCIQVFAAAGPLAEDDGADLGFLSARMVLSGTAMQTLITRVAPRLATAMGQKLAAQTVPVLGAAAGAATNYAYVNYYTDIAHVHFGLRRLAIAADIPHEAAVDKLRAALEVPRKSRSGRQTTL